MEKDNYVLKLENVSKKYCKSLKLSMIYGISDISRNLMGMSSKPGTLRNKEFWAVDDVSFELKQGVNLGIIGPNGSGKTTLLKMLNGIFWPDKGKISVNGRLGALIEVGAGFHPLLTGRENIHVNGAILGMTKQEIDKHFDEIVDFAGIGDFLDTPVKNYSSGMFVKLGFSIAVHCNPDILLIDEVLAVGDKGFQAKCFNKIGELKQNGTTTILVSHNMHHISTFSNHVLLLNYGKPTLYEDAAQGTCEYSKLFAEIGDSEIEKIVSGNDKINFYDVKLDKKEYAPGDSMEITLNYTSSQDYTDVEIDTGMYTNKEPDLYFQATNKAFNKRVDLLKGSHSLKIRVNNVQANDASVLAAFSIWSHDRAEKLFWWRIPVTFKGVTHSSGRNFLNVDYFFI